LLNARDILLRFREATGVAVSNSRGSKLYAVNYLCGAL
jgi:hypothetical protein